MNPSLSFAQSSGFVSRNGSDLELDINKFRFIGVNRYNLLTVGGIPFVGCGTVLSETDIAQIFDELKQQKVTAIRFWLFQSFTKSGIDLSRFDYVLAQAAQNNIKVIPVFENQWQDCTQGGYKYNDWYKAGYKAPYGTYSLSLKDYINRIVPKYKDNPAILMWQIMNEAESKENSAIYTTDAQSLLNFATDISTYIKSLDQNHLVSFGTMGGGQPGTAGSAYRTLHALPSIDVLEYHDYGDEQLAVPPRLQERINDAKALAKPLIIGESGIVTQSTCSGGTTLVSGFKCFSNAERAALMNSKMNAFFSTNEENAGFMIWSYRDKTVGNNDIFAFSLQDPLSTVVSANAVSLLPSPPSTSNKIGDIDHDGDIDIYDYNKLIGDFGQTGTSLDSDIDKTNTSVNKVDIYDFNLLLSKFNN